MGILRQLADIVRDIERFYALKMLRWIIRIHYSLDVGPPHYTWCANCNKPWPCEPMVTAVDRIDALKQR